MCICSVNAIILVFYFAFTEHVSLPSALYVTISLVRITFWKRERNELLPRFCVMEASLPDCTTAFYIRGSTCEIFHKPKFRMKKEKLQLKAVDQLKQIYVEVSLPSAV